MTSKYQTRLFPKDKLGRFQTIKVTDPDNNTVEILYPELDLQIVNGQLCWHYESDEGDLIMPIARISTITTLISKDDKI